MILLDIIISVMLSPFSFCVICLCGSLYINILRYVYQVMLAERSFSWVFLVLKT